MLTLHAVIEPPREENPIGWARYDENIPWVRLHAASTPRDCELAAAGVVMYGTRRRMPFTDIDSALRHTIEDTTHVVAGGLILTKGDFVVAPGCCCGFEGWRDWEEVRRGGVSPWMGHDPAPWIDCTGAQAIVWSDGAISARPAEAKSLYIDYDEITDALERASSDLTAFVERLEAHFNEVGARDARAFAAGFAEWFHIAPP